MFGGGPRMTCVFMKEWDAAVEKNLRDFYDTLSEKDRRRFAAVQARQLGHGGVTYLAKVRRPGAGRKKSVARLAS